MTANGLAAARAIVAAVVRQTPAYEIADPVALAALDDPTCDPSFESLGVDSLGRMEFCILLAEQFGIELAADDLVAHATVGDLARHLSDAQGQTRDGADVHRGDEVLDEYAPDRAGVTGPARDTALRAATDLDWVALFSAVSTDTEGYQLQIRFEEIATPEEVTALAELVDGPVDLRGSVRDSLALLGDQLRVEMTEPRRFVREALAESVELYRCTDGAGPARSLIVVFTGNAHRFFLPIAVVLQHLPPDHDVVVLIDRSKRHYLHGLPGVADDLRGVCDWLTTGLVDGYDEVVCLGSSAGGATALAAGELLGARRAVCAGGRPVDALATPEGRAEVPALAGSAAAGSPTTSRTELWSVFSSGNERDRAGALAFWERDPSMVLVTVPEVLAHNPLRDTLYGGGLARLLDLIVRGAVPTERDAEGIALAPPPPPMLPVFEQRAVRSERKVGADPIARRTASLFRRGIGRALRSVRPHRPS